MMFSSAEKEQQFLAAFQLLAASLDRLGMNCMGSSGSDVPGTTEMIAMEMKRLADYANDLVLIQENKE